MCGNHLSRPPADLSYQLQAGFKTQTTSGSGAQRLAGAHNFIFRKCLGTRQRTVSQTLSLFSGVSALSGRELTNSMGKNFHAVYLYRTCIPALPTGQRRGSVSCGHVHLRGLTMSFSSDFARAIENLFAVL